MAIPIPIIGALIDGVSGFVEKRQERKLAETKAKVERIQKADDAVQEWELIHAEASKTSWKDEYWTIILSVPMVLSFVPPAVPFVVDGFAALDQMPEWYRYFLMIAIGASFGIRQVRR